ncbi:hypothetical protein Tco_1332046, partial [Tanacetum coccineum]
VNVFLNRKVTIANKSQNPSITAELRIKGTESSKKSNQPKGYQCEQAEEIVDFEEKSPIQQFEPNLRNPHITNGFLQCDRKSKNISLLNLTIPHLLNNS